MEEVNKEIMFELKIGAAEIVAPIIVIDYMTEMKEAYYQKIIIKVKRLVFQAKHLVEICTD